jgi:hypothetical protein
VVLHEDLHRREDARYRLDHFFIYTNTWNQHSWEVPLVEEVDKHVADGWACEKEIDWLGSGV